MHEMLGAIQSEGNKSLAYVRALAYLLVEKGIVNPNELRAMMQQVRWELVREPTPRVRLGSTRDKYTAAAWSMSIGESDADLSRTLLYVCVLSDEARPGRRRRALGLRQPVWIKQGADGHCTHSDPVTRFCTIHAHRPFSCRKFDCRNDERIWLDFEKRIPAPPLPAPGDDSPALAELLLHQPASQAKPNWMNPED